MEYRRLLVVAVLGGLVVGCASGAASPANPGPGGVTMHEDKDVDRVWVAPDFTFTGYDTLYLIETQAEVAKLNPDGRENLEWARGVLREEFAKALRGTNVFATVGVHPMLAQVLQVETSVARYGFQQ